MTNISGRDRSVNRSCDLEAANARLFQLREQFAKRKSNKKQGNSQREIVPSAPVTTSGGWLEPLRKRLTEAEKGIESASSSPESTPIVPEPAPTTPESSHLSLILESETIRVYPSVLAGILKQELAPCGRVWLLARYLDKSGRGWITEHELREALTNKGSPLRICGWRRLRQILQQGNNTLWQKDSLGRIWLYSNKKVAINLELERLTGKSVHLPIKTLIGSIATTKAAFYASFHAGRRETPISRATLQSITGVSERSQRTYDKLANVTTQTNFSLDEVANKATEKEAAYDAGSAFFIFEDTAGKFGRKGQKYHARQLPNSYTTTYEAVRSKQQQKINQALRIDLVKQEVLGNDSQSDQSLCSCYCLTAKKVRAAKKVKDSIFLLGKKQGEVVIWHKM